VTYVLQGFRVDTLALSERVLAPAEPGLLQATEAVRLCRSPREAWEALIARGALPLDWATDERRLFGLTGGERTSPLRVADAVRLAAAPEHALAAELHARLAAERGAPWMSNADGATPVGQRPIVWRFVEPARRRRTGEPGGRGTIRDLNLWVYSTAIANEAALRELSDDPTPTKRPGWRGALDSVLDRVGLRRGTREANSEWNELCAQASARSFGLLASAMWDLRLAWTWDALGALGVLTREQSAPFPGPARWKGVAFSSLPNPYEPRVALWLSGFAPRLVLPTGIELVTVSTDVGRGSVASKKADGREGA
jgi:hypothetical protein